MSQRYGQFKLKYWTSRLQDFMWSGGIIFYWLVNREPEFFANLRFSPRRSRTSSELYSVAEVQEEEGETDASRDFTGTGSTGEVGSTRSVPLAAPMSLSELLTFNWGATLGSTRSNILASASHPSPATPGPVGREGDLSVTWARRGALAPENDTSMHNGVTTHACQQWSIV